jgi:hypothetical protein
MFGPDKYVYVIENKKNQLIDKNVRKGSQYITIMLVINILLTIMMGYSQSIIRSDFPILMSIWSSASIIYNIIHGYIFHKQKDMSDRYLIIVFFVKLSIWILGVVICSLVWSIGDNFYICYFMILISFIDVICMAVGGFIFSLYIDTINNNEKLRLFQLPS